MIDNTGPFLGRTPSAASPPSTKPSGDAHEKSAESAPFASILRDTTKKAQARGHDAKPVTRPKAEKHDGPAQASQGKPEREADAAKHEPAEQTQDTTSQALPPDGKARPTDGETVRTEGETLRTDGEAGQTAVENAKNAKPPAGAQYIEPNAEQSPTARAGRDVAPPQAAEDTGAAKAWGGPDPAPTSPDAEAKTGSEAQPSDTQPAGTQPAGAQPAEAREARSSADESAAAQPAVASNPPKPITIHALNALLLRGGPASAALRSTEGPVVSARERLVGRDDSGSDCAGTPAEARDAGAPISRDNSGETASGVSGSTATEAPSIAAVSPCPSAPASSEAGNPQTQSSRDAASAVKVRPAPAAAQPDPFRSLMADANLAGRAPIDPNRSASHQEAARVTDAVGPGKPALSDTAIAAGRPGTGTGGGADQTHQSPLGTQSWTAVRAQRHAGDAHAAFQAQVTRGLMSALRQSAESGDRAATLRLQPVALGRLKVQVVSREGAVSARFEVSTSEARQLLERSFDNLRASLNDKGLSVDRLDIHVTPPDQQRADAGPNQLGDGPPLPGNVGGDAAGANTPDHGGSGSHRGASGDHDDSNGASNDESVDQSAYSHSPPSLTLQLIDTIV
jgi:flagellar hook-length control protein FliK